MIMIKYIYNPWRDGHKLERYLENENILHRNFISPISSNPDRLKVSFEEIIKINSIKNKTYDIPYPVNKIYILLLNVN